MKTRGQRGFSLVSLMVGTVVSMIVVVAMVAVYKVTLHLSVSAAQDARSDGQTASALLIAQMALQNAGFGVADAVYGCPAGGSATGVVCVFGDARFAGNKVVGTSKAVGQAGNAVIASWKTAANLYGCAMLIYDTAYNDGMGGLLYATTTAASLCNADTAWPTPSMLVLDRASTENGNRPVGIVVEDKACSSFGIFGSGSLLLTIAGVKSDKLQSIGSVCLVNLSSS